MKKFIIGALVLLIGVPGFAFNFSNFLHFLAGVIPALMILGGAIAVYLGIEDLKQSDDCAESVEPEIELGAERIEKYAEKQKKESEAVTVEPVPEPIEKPEEAVTDNQDEQPEPEAQQESETPSTEPQQPVDFTAPETEEPTGESVQFKGNIETLVFHTVECNFASGKNCSMDFATKEEAETQGYKPCKICMPDT
nr:Ada metal-binding domain-containing protein [uncultured Desulfobacter sp.]